MSIRAVLPRIGAQAWLPVEDISFVLDRVLQDDFLSTHINTHSIGAAGGYSVLAVAGARLDRDKIVKFCQAEPQNRNCAFYLADNVEFDKLDKTKYESSYKDKRFTYVIALDPGYSTPPAYLTLYNNKSIRDINIPVLLVSAEQFSPIETHINTDYFQSCLC